MGYASHKSLDLYLGRTNITWIQRLKICLGAARGLRYLHNPKGSEQRVLHRDIKSANILLDKDWNAKIADFGISKIAPANQRYTFIFSNVVGTLGYCDPVYLETMLLSKESDVYLFGVVLFEVLCGRRCLELDYDDHYRVLPTLVKNCYEKQMLHVIINDSLRRDITPTCFDTYIAIAYQCFERDREKRPSMDLIMSKLEAALANQSLTGSPYISKDISYHNRTFTQGKQDTQEDIPKQHKQEMHIFSVFHLESYIKISSPSLQSSWTRIELEEISLKSQFRNVAVETLSIVLSIPQLLQEWIFA